MRKSWCELTGKKYGKLTSAKIYGYRNGKAGVKGATTWLLRVCQSNARSVSTSAGGPSASSGRSGCGRRTRLAGFCIKLHICGRPLFKFLAGLLDWGWATHSSSRSLWRRGTPNQYTGFALTSFCGSLKIRTFYVSGHACGSDSLALPLTPDMAAGRQAGGARFR